jgi:hypothetical protein
MRDPALELGRGLRPVRRIMLEHREHDRIEHGRHRWIQRARRRHVGPGQPAEQPDVGILGEQRLPDQQLPEHDTQRKDVAAPVDRGARRLLRRDVVVLPLERDAGRGLRETVARLRDPEVDQLRVAVGGQQDVRGADVAMDDVERLAFAIPGLVRSVQPGCHLDDDPRGELGVELATVAVVDEQQLADRAAIEVLHDQVVDAFDHAELLDVDHVRVADLRADPRLVDEHLDEGRLIDQVRVDHLERNQPREPGRAVAAREVERRHPSDSQPLHDLVLTEPLPRHCFTVVTK